MITPDALGEILLQTGTIQFGHFVIDGHVRKWIFNSALLPSYPELLLALGQIGQDKISTYGVDRLVCLQDSLSIAQAISLTSEIPLVYHGHHTGNPVIDFVGAYDVGHPTCLITNHTSSQDTFSQLLKDADRVGLRITNMLALYGSSPALPESVGFSTLIDLPAIIRSLEAKGTLHASLAQSILQDMTNTL